MTNDPLHTASVEIVQMSAGEAIERAKRIIESAEEAVAEFQGRYGAGREDALNYVRVHWPNRINLTAPIRKDQRNDP